MELIQLPIVDRKEVGGDVFEVSFGLSETDFHFQAGQYIRVTISPLLYPDAKGNFRDFFLCSSSSNHSYISIAFRRTESGFKKTLLELPIGSLVSVRGAYGLLELPEDTHRNIVFIAFGIGITPFLSMIRFASESKYPNYMMLIYVNTDKNDTPYLDELTDLQEKIPHFVMRQKTTPLGGDFLRKEVAYAKESLWYISGPVKLVQETFDALLQLGVPLENIVSEEMVGYDDMETKDSVSVLQQASTNPSAENTLSVSDAMPILSDVKKLNAIIETIAEGVVITDSEGIILYVNPEWQRITGWKSEEVVGKVTPRILKSGKTTPEEYEKLWKTIKRGEIAYLDIINRRKNGNFYNAEDVILPLKNEQGDITEFVGFQRDVTEKQRYMKQFILHSEELAEQNKFLEDTKKAMLNLLEDAEALEKSLEIEKIAIKEEKEKSEGILQFLKSIGDGVLAVDSDSNIIFMNKIAEDLSGYTFEEVKGKHYAEFFHFILKENPNFSYDNFIQKIIKTGVVGSLPSHTSFIKRDETAIPISDNAAPIRDASGAVVGCIVVFRDDTKKRELDQLKENFISVAAHQLRTPLGGMRWSIEMLLSGDAGALPEEAREGIEQLYENSQRMVTLVNDLLNTTRIDDAATKGKAELKSSDIIPILRKVVKDVSREAKLRSVTINFAVDENQSVNVVISSKDIYEAFQNLLVNAIKYNNTGGSVTISISQSDDDARIAIADTGIGIPKDQQSKLFAKFFRASNAILKETDGSGLGLNVVRYFVEESNGRIWFDSVENEGTTFYVELPLAK